MKPDSVVKLKLLDEQKTNIDDGLLDAGRAGQILSPEFMSVFVTADKAINLSAAHLTPPRPSIYSVWFNYITGDNREAKSRLRALMQGGAPVSAYDLEQIHSEYLASDALRQSAIELANKRLERELGEVLAAVQSHIDSSETYCGSLSRKTQSLNAQSSAENIRTLIEALLSENAAMRTKTVTMARSLEQSKTQVSALHAALIESRINAETDPLTGIANRRGFQERLRDEIGRSKMNGRRLCLVMADIDHFKRINDTFGHTIGDEVLRYFARVLQRQTVPEGSVARYGGEEFALIFPGTGHAAAKQHAELLREQFCAARLVVSESREQIGDVTASFGVAEHLAGEPLESLVQRADEKLYRAKAAGRNRVI
jgi:diguanylate cyclase